ncbi:hypothetical protein QLQ12_09405 [Actinoplanes sp. NEAU-A12]|uniref:Uncharacterized protein n=1 Tax=Actinoplanes sandaracinus TaxID=3045177 RepID=A0ABT6WGG6_9ACTN|nr:hypothetical protein [Actinoplanes sandaracinus]MDI6098814.1 hypothetical protein [Actinoplanes sandaracinus]
MTLLPRSISLQAAERLRCPSATPGLDFEVTFSARYRAGRTPHENLDSLVRHTLVVEARREAENWDLDEQTHYADALNAQLGKSSRCHEGYYTRLTAKAVVNVSSQARMAAIQLRDDKIRLERLQRLKGALYTDPGLVAIDFLDRNPSLTITDTDLARFRKLAHDLKHHEQWWWPVMTAWSDLALKTESPEAASHLMEMLRQAILQLNRKLAESYGIVSSKDPFSS